VLGVGRDAMVEGFGYPGYFNTWDIGGGKIEHGFGKSSRVSGCRRWMIPIPWIIVQRRTAAVPVAAAELRYWTGRHNIPETFSVLHWMKSSEGFSQVLTHNFPNRERLRPVSGHHSVFVAHRTGRHHGVFQQSIFASH
jgi:hypothetical protein